MADTPLAPIKVKDLPAFLRAVAPMFAALSNGDITTALAEHPDNLITATAIGAGVEREWLEDQGLDTLADLAFQVLEANLDFFAKTLLPRITTLTEKIETLAGGTNGLPASLAQGSDLRP